MKTDDRHIIKIKQEWDSVKIYAAERRGKKIVTFKINISEGQDLHEGMSRDIDPSFTFPPFGIGNAEALEVLKTLHEALHEFFMQPDPTSAQMDAIKYHLEDMRKLVFNERSVK